MTSIAPARRTASSSESPRRIHTSGATTGHTGRVLRLDKGRLVDDVAREGSPIGAAS